MSPIRSFATVLAGALLALAPTTRAGDLLFTASFDEPAEGPYNDYEAARFLTQATFGPTMPEIQRLRQIGYNAWLNEQLNLAFSSHRPYLDALAAANQDVGQNVRYEAFFQRALTAPDQLRQRVALALSEILVVSDQGAGLGGEPFALAHYHDLLGTHGFGNYRALLEQVTLSPVMGRYLSMLQNRKPDEGSNVRPDENYAREIMQLFSVGLVQLNLDGTAVDGDTGIPGIQTVPTFNQNTIRGFAHVFTGWTFNGCPVREFEWCGAGETGAGWLQPMQTPEGPWWGNTPPWFVWHAYLGDKQLLVYPGVSLAGGVLPGSPEPLAAHGNPTPYSNLVAALDNVAAHPNVGPFLAQRLIQRLVTSNPEPDYVARVASVFNNNGSGVRGDLRAMVRAVLMDPDARARPVAGSHQGKLREPMLRMTQLWRAFAATNPTGRYQDWWIWWPGQYVPQMPLHARTVFNFFLPDYQPAGEIASNSWVAPEFQIQTDGYVTNFSNVLDTMVWNYVGNPSEWADPDATKINLASERALSGNASIGRLLERLDVLMMSGSMSTHMRNTLRTYLLAIPVGDEAGYRRAWEALWLIMVSPEYVIEK